MALTPDGAQVPYCDPATFLLTYDSRYIGQLVRSDGTSATATQLLVDPVLAQHLSLASGVVESACLKGKRYGASDLANLYGNGQALLKWLVAALALQSLYEFRTAALPPEFLPQVNRANNMLDDIRDGEAIFPFAEIGAAGNPSQRFRTELEKDAANLLTRSSASDRFLGKYHGRN